MTNEEIIRKAEKLATALAIVGFGFFISLAVASVEWVYIYLHIKGIIN